MKNTLVDFEKDQTFIECECHGHGILVTEFIDIYTDKLKKEKKTYRQEFWLSMFTYGQFNSKPSVWQRLKYMWYHLRTGKKYDDAIIMSPENTKKLIEFLQGKLDDFKRYKL